MQIHMAQLTKQRISDFFVKEDGHVAHKNAFVAGTVATGAILASLMITPDAEACPRTPCPDESNQCSWGDTCCAVQVTSNHWQYWCTSGAC